MNIDILKSHLQMVTRTLVGCGLQGAVTSIQVALKAAGEELGVLVSPVCQGDHNILIAVEVDIPGKDRGYFPMHPDGCLGPWTLPLQTYWEKPLPTPG